MVMMRRFFAWSLASQPSRVVAWPAALIPRILLLLNLAYNACAMVHLIWSEARQSRA